MEVLKIKELSNKLIGEAFITRLSKALLAPCQKVDEIQSILNNEFLLLSKIVYFLMKISPNYEDSSTGDVLYIEQVLFCRIQPDQARHALCQV